MEKTKINIRNNYSNLKAKLVKWSLEVKFDGWAKIFRYKNKFLKFIWLLIFLTFSGLTSYLVCLNMIDYFQHDVVTKIEVISERPTTFPTLTLCNSNPFTTKSDQVLMQNLMYELYGEDINGSDISFYKAYERIQSVTKIAKLRKAFQNKTETFNFNIVNCKFNKAECDKQSDFNSIYLFDYGYCWQFNSGLKTNLKQSVTEGAEFGFRLMLDNLFELLNESNKYPATYSKGLILFVHNQSYIPTSSSEGIYLEPSTDSFISIERTFTFNEPSPFSPCQDSGSADVEIDAFIRNSNQIYQQSTCLNLCLQKYVINECGCYYPKYGMVIQSQSCLNRTQMNCVSGLISKFTSKYLDECLNKCPLECNSIKYEMQLSTLSYPNEQILQLLKELYKDQSSLFDNYKESAYSINVFYPYLDYTQITQSPKTLPIDLISQIGGSLGMFLSLSLFHFAEFIELIIESLLILFKRK